LGRRFGHVYPPEKAIFGHTVSNLQKQGSRLARKQAVARIFAAFHASSLVTVALAFSAAIYLGEH